MKEETETTTVSVLCICVLFAIVMIHREFACLTGSSAWKEHFHLIF